MKVALFTDSYLPNTDGVVSSILAFRKGLAAKGHSMEIFAPSSPEAVPEKGVRRFASVSFPPYPDYRPAIFPYVPAEIAKKEGIDLVHCKGMVNMGLSAIAFSKSARLPCMASLETMIPDGMHYLFPFPSMQKAGQTVAWAYLRWFYSNFDLVTCPSKHSQSVLRQHGIESTVLPSPIDTGRFRPNRNGEKVRRRMGLGKKKVIASVGRVVKEKNYSFLVKAARHMKGEDAIFLIVGKGPYLESLKREAADAGVGGMFHFAGFVPDRKLVDYYNAADAFAFPSKFETQGLTLLEAFACGKPAAVMEGTPMEELVKRGKTGFVFASEEECAKGLLAAAEASGRMAAAARKTALSYSIPECTARLLSAYKRLL